jgi:hypothetical protein
MDQTKTSANQSLLRDKGILLESGEICQDKINLISGAVTAPLVEMLWTFSGNDKCSMDRISVLFTHLYEKGHEAEMISVLRILFDVSGLQFPEDVECLGVHPSARQYFLFSFLLDMDDCIMDFTDETPGE